MADNIWAHKVPVHACFNTTSTVAHPGPNYRWYYPTEQWFHQTAWCNISYPPVVPQPFACCRFAGEPTYRLFPQGFPRSEPPRMHGYLQGLHPASPRVRPPSMDRRGPISPPGTRPHPAQSNEIHWWPNPAAHLSHSSSCQCIDLPLQASMHLRPSPVDKYGSTSHPTHSSSANPCSTWDRHQYELSCPLPVA